ncbi:hypothetical protein C8A05DRAFT_20419, partial [Staphylotrichum tortipilum]
MEPTVASPISSGAAVPNGNTTLQIRQTVAKQLEALGTVNLKELASQPYTDWPVLWHKRKRYLLDDWVPKKKARTSWVTDHGSFLIELTSAGSTGSTSWCCKHCNAVFVGTATTSPLKHLRNKHGFTEPTTNDLSTNDPKIPTVLDIQRASAMANPVLKPTAESVLNLALSWIVSSDQPFTSIENPYFRRLIRLLNPQLASFVPASGDTIRREVRKWYDKEKAVLRDTLRATQSQKHLSFDAWTAPNSTAFLAIVVHFANEDLNLQTSLL